jgi:hypothetical protein
MASACSPITGAPAVDVLGWHSPRVVAGHLLKPPFGIAKFAVNVSSPDTNKSANKLDGCVELSRVFSTRRENIPENLKTGEERKLLLSLTFSAWCPWPAIV